MVQLLANLLSNGFTLSEATDFLERSRLLKPAHTELMRQGLLEGKGLSQILSYLGFSDQLVTQLALADAHGNTQACLSLLEKYLIQVAQVRKKILEVLTYPLILLGFLTMMMLGLRTYLLPQMEGENFASRLIAFFPQLVLGAILLLTLVSLSCYHWARQSEKIALYNTLSRLPFVGQLIGYYLTAYYAREWGNLIGQGIELAQLVKLMQEQKSQLFQELGKDLERALLAGQPFQDKVATYRFFRPELHLIIAYGQIKSKLGTELSIYARECWETFFAKINQASQLIQPLVFLFVALMIVMIYAAMLLPIYQNIPSVF